ncbi:helix-turn-helix transcriptional regulator [Streptomyces durbertensis]|uniref:Helix-turn-helix transcriptional regulator n=1 Tax=Streptomyces durbertensis TaxID=2448886 RepID=A0ABR6EIR5_9ACTN|nr:helix-turn-helix transcriptional regulator [Streptomyces durbertensis]MBB1245216.1 helix-turn-helix transcriptional regulator [Streptomyces durbertensis]
MSDAPGLRYDISVGRRIKAIRNQRGLTQHGLAQRSHVSYSTLTKVESGHLAASPTVTAACARALRVPVTDLTGQPYMDALRRDRLEEFVQPIRHAIVSPGLSREEGAKPRNLEAVRVDLSRLETSRLRGEYLVIGSEGPALIGELVTIADTTPPGPDRQRVYSALAIMYCLARYFTHKLGFLDLGLLALERMEAASALSADPYLPAVVCHYRSDYLLHHGGYDIGLRQVALVERMLEEPSRRGNVRAQSLLGTMQLKAAVIHARRRGGSSAVDVRGRIREAQQVAHRIKGQPDPYGLVFDEVNVGIHQVSTLIDLGEPGQAVEYGERLRLPSGWALNRQGHHQMDMARAYEQLGRADKALHALISARDAAPAQTRYHPTTRETVLALLRRRGTPSPQLRAYSRWLGI